MGKLMLAAGLIALSLAASMTARAEEVVSRFITMNGHGEVRRAPDLATISMGVTTQAEMAAAALDANSQTMQVMLSALKQTGIADNDVQTTDFLVQPRLDYGNNTGQPPKTVGYDVTNQVTVTVRDLSALGAILDKAVQSGSNQVSGISFSVKNPESALDEARQKAVADAVRKAEVYAAAAGVRLGRIMSISESTAMPGPVPMRARAMDAAAAPPIAAGEQTLGLDVTINWEIQ
jgi:hypothetical protein